MNPGVVLPLGDQTVEGFAAAWERISDRTEDDPLQNGMDQSRNALESLMRAPVTS
jgi:hypothetical protein